MDFLFDMSNTRLECERLKKENEITSRLYKGRIISQKRMTNRHEVALVPVNEDVHVMNNIPMTDHKLQKSFGNRSLINVQQNQYLPLIQVHVKAL